MLCLQLWHRIILFYFIFSYWVWYSAAHLTSNAGDPFEDKIKISWKGLLRNSSILEAHECSSSSSFSSVTSAYDTCTSISTYIYKEQRFPSIQHAKWLFSFAFSFAPVSSPLAFLNSTNCSKFWSFLKFTPNYEFSHSFFKPQRVSE
ncbi:hypothetical protein SAY86_032127 [Trapa natans]|uniref:Uncharacterized protein n=1 Tax=Trapa natans TaxID=22666 RepID=A0AAN7LVA3_TRANT|nr:hypothetical protein SAY86_032127 [Trapa natans]